MMSTWKNREVVLYLQIRTRERSEVPCMIAGDQLKNTSEYDLSVI